MAKTPPQPKKGLELQQQLLTNAIKPTKDPKVQKQNEARFAKLQQVNAQIEAQKKAQTSASGTPSTKPPKGVFQNKTTGAYTDSKGNPVDATGTPIVEAAPEEAVSSYEDIGKALIQSEYDKNTAVAEDLGLGPVYGSIDEQYNDTIQKQREQKALQEAQLTEQQDQLNYDTSQSRNQMEAAADTGAGQLAPNREGFSSISNTTAAQQLKTATNERIARLQKSAEVANLAIEQARKDLSRAERAGNTELAAKYRQQLDAATAEAKAIDTEHISALTEQRAQELDEYKTKNAVIQSGIQTFQGLVQDGTEMSYDTVKATADQLGLPTDMLMGYYNGAQSIRDDKTLDNETKKIELAKLNQDFSDQLAGLQSEEAKNVSNYMKLVQSGKYSEEELATFATSMNIPNDKNPVYIADLKVKQAEAKIKEAEANGELINPLDQIQLAQDMADYYAMLGVTPGTLPASGGSVDTTAIQTSNGIQFNFTDGASISSGTRALSQCGQFVNDVLGLSMGDSYSSKMAYVDKNIRMPAAGMAFVMPVTGDYAANGHTGIVEYFDAVTGMVGVADVNADGTGKAMHHEIPLATILNGGGFVPGRGTPLSSGSNSDFDVTSVSASDVSLINNFLETGKVPDVYKGQEQQFMDMANKFSAAATDPSTPLKQALTYTTGKKALTDTAVQSIQKNILSAEQLGDLQAAFEETGEDAWGPILGTLRSANPYDVKAQTLKAQLTALVPGLARGVYGEVGVLTDADIANYTKTLPNLTSPAELRTALFDMTKKIIGRSLETKLRSYAGTYDVSGYQFIVDDYGLGEQPSTNSDFQEAFTTVEDNISNGRYQ